MVTQTVLLTTRNKSLWNMPTIAEVFMWDEIAYDVRFWMLTLHSKLNSKLQYTFLWPLWLFLVVDMVLSCGRCGLWPIWSVEFCVTISTEHFGTIGLHRRLCCWQLSVCPSVRPSNPNSNPMALECSVGIAIVGIMSCYRSVANMVQIHHYTGRCFWHVTLWSLAVNQIWIH